MPLIPKQTVHRPGPMKQVNKPHKGSKDKKHYKGKQSVKATSLKKFRELSRIERKNRMNQLRKAKKYETMIEKRNLGGVHNQPILSIILPLNDCTDADKFLADLKVCDVSLQVADSKNGNCHISSPDFKKRFTFFIPDKRNLHAVMDALKVADVLILIHSSDAPDDYMEMVLSSIVAHALPTVIHVVQGMDKLDQKKKADCRKNILKYMESRFANEKLHKADTAQEFQLLFRQIASQRQRPVGFRDSRFHMLAEDVEFEPSDSEMELGTLKVSGYARGQPINVNNLVCLSGHGTFQMSQIDYDIDPHPLVNKAEMKRNKDLGISIDIVTGVILSDKADPVAQESLQAEVIPDPMDGEQTWPTKDELEAAELKHKKTVKRVEEGTSDYQAAWIVDSEEDEVSDDDEQIDCAQTMTDSIDEMDQDMEYVESVTDMKDENYDKTLDLDEEKKMLVRFKEERMNEMFPDEQDTPIDISARTRFQRYRGLKNFKSSPWDPLENLPPDYARIFRFENFKQTMKKILTEKEGPMLGIYVTLHIKNVPRLVYDNLEELKPLVVYGLLPHEQKMSVVNVVIQKHPTCKTPVKSKDQLIFHIGYQRFMCRPIFSEHKTGNKFKLERFLPRDAAVVASFYAPVIFPPASVVVFKLHQDGSHELVATGSVLNIDPNRVVVKRVLLSGHPFKIFKRTAVVRYMFFNKDDINWFKCVELQTKCGRKGHIRESLGSHGHMKCIFDKQLQSQDVVLMSLYKRQFPKWSYEPCVPTPTNYLICNKSDIESMI